MPVTFTGSRQDLRLLLSQLAAALAGKGPDPFNVVQGLQLRLGVALLSKIQQAFLVKARGGTGEDGIRWAPLKPETIARRRLGPADVKAVRLKHRAPQLTEAQRRQLEKRIRQRTNELIIRFGLPVTQAQGLARAQVEAAQRKDYRPFTPRHWARGAPGEITSKFAILSTRDVEILSDTRELLRSFSPGVEDRPSGAEGQVFDTPSGRVIVGTNKKPWHHRGIPGRLPSRPYWPLDGSLPSSWWQAMLGTLSRGLVRVVAQLAQGG